MLEDGTIIEKASFLPFRARNPSGPVRQPSESSNCIARCGSYGICGIVVSVVAMARTVGPTLGIASESNTFLTSAERSIAIVSARLVVTLRNSGFGDRGFAGSRMLKTIYPNLNPGYSMSRKVFDFAICGSIDARTAEKKSASPARNLVDAAPKSLGAIVQITRSSFAGAR